MVNTTQPRTYAAAHFALALDGAGDVGLFRSIEGGNVKADVMTYQSGPIYDRWRQLGKPKFEDIKLQVGMAMSEPFYTWIEKFFLGDPDRKNGSIIAADFYYKERARREFTNAMISELTFPKLDGADKNAAFMGIGLAVEGMVFKPGDGQRIVQSKGWSSQKLWTACNFRFRIDNFEGACRRVSKIDSFTVKMAVLEYHAGGHRAPIKTPSPIDFPNIAFYVPEADAQLFYNHAQRRIIADSAEQPGRLTGQISTYDNELKDLFTIEFSGAEIISVTPDKSDSTTEEIKQVKIEICTEKMKFTYKPNAVTV
jgi:phage tail-like protein